MKTLYTERLTLRPWKESDANDLFAYAQDPEVGPMAGWKPHRSVEESQEIVKKFILADETWAIINNADNKLIGSVGLHRDPKRRFTTLSSRELGYVLSRRYWGRGIMTEACREVLRYAFCVMNLSIVSVGHYDFNDRSKIVIEKLGFTYDGHLSLCYELDGKVYGESLYYLTNKDYYLSMRKDPSKITE